MKENYLRPAQLIFGILTALFIIFQTYQAQAQYLQDSLGTTVKNYYESGMFNGFVRVEKRGQILLNQSYGMADYQKLIPLSDESRFRLGSLSKQFTSYIILNLAQEGKLNLSDSLRKYIPDYLTAKRVTINQLLHHTAGIPNFTDFNDYDSIKRLPDGNDQLVLKRIKNMPLDFEPGTNFNYSNSGYILLAMIAEKVTGHSWAQLTKKYITRPAQLSNTGIERSRMKDGIMPGYDEDLKAMVNVADRINPSIAKGGGNSFSSAADLSKWIDYLLGQNDLNDSFQEALFTTDKENYAKGWEVFVSDQYKERVIYHNGGIDGFRTAVVLLPAQGIKIIILCNMESGIVPRQLPFLLLDITIGKSVTLPVVKKIQPVDILSVKEFEGEYLLNGKLPIQVRFKDDYLTIQFPHQPAVRLYSIGDDQFFTMVVDAGIVFHRDDTGLINSFTFLQGEAKISAHRNE